MICIQTKYISRNTGSRPSVLQPSVLFLDTSIYKNLLYYKLILYSLQENVLFFIL